MRGKKRGMVDGRKGMREKMLSRRCLIWRTCSDPRHVIDKDCSTCGPRPTPTTCAGGVLNHAMLMMSFSFSILSRPALCSVLCPPRIRSFAGAETSLVSRLATLAHHVSIALTAIDAVMVKGATRQRALALCQWRAVKARPKDVENGCMRLDLRRKGCAGNRGLAPRRSALVPARP